jgi:carboxypeptidase PM20D1
MAWIKRMNIPLQRDIVLLAVADEEVHNTGAIFLAEERWADIGCSHLINEGGIGLIDMLFEGQTVYPISVGEKGHLWLKMIARGEPGHGSTPRPGEAPRVLVEAINKLEDRKIDIQIHDSLMELLSSVGDDKGGLNGFIMKRPWLVKRLVKPKLMKSPLTRAGIIDTVHLTGLHGYNSPNVVPSEVFALLDCRTLPDTDPRDHLAYIKEIVGDGLELEIISSTQGNLSSWQGDPLYEAIARQVTRQGHVPGPVISVGFTDSIYMRPLGVQAFGFMPFELTGEDMVTFHGNDERISIVNLRRGLEMMMGAVLEVSAAKQ